MSKKKDPIVAVLQYFEDAELMLAVQALALAQAIVRRRRGPHTPPKPKSKVKPKEQPLQPLAN